MCGRFFLDALPETLAGPFGVARFPDYTAHWNLAPTASILVIRAASGPREALFARFGLVPAFARTLQAGVSTFNARGETLEEKPTFRDAFRLSRCLIPASGWYEWTADTTGTKQPWAIGPLNAPVLAFGGLLATARIDGEPLISAAIVTTPSNADVAPLHERMPLLLDPADWGDWLRGRLDTARALIRPAPVGRLRRWRVGRAVGNVRNDHPGLIAPVAAPRPSNGTDSRLTPTADLFDP